MGLYSFCPTVPPLKLSIVAFGGIQLLLEKKKKKGYGPYTSGK